MARPSYFAGKYMLEQATPYPVNPKYESVLGQPCFPNLRVAREGPGRSIWSTAFAAPRTSSAVMRQLQSRQTLWMQLASSMRRPHARRALPSWTGDDRCVKIEHARLFGGLNWRA